MYRLVILLGLLLGVSGCQNRVNEAGSSYREKVVAWNQLATYAGSTFNEFDIKLTAKLDYKVLETGQPVFTFKQAMLNNRETNTDINLLSPTFQDKFLCHNKCTKVSELSPLERETKLSLFFEQNEGELFEFYGNLTLMNERLDFYKASIPELFSEYLVYLQKQKFIYANLIELSEQLDFYLQQEQIEAFANNNKKSLEKQSQSSAVAELVIHTSDIPLWSDESDTFASNEEFISPTESWLGSDETTPSEQLLRDLIEEEQVELSLTRKTFANISVHAKTIFLGNNVCSFSDNSFGTVKAIDGELVTVVLSGVVMLFQDGMIRTAKPSYIMLEQQEFSFVPTTGDKVYSKDDLMNCSLSTDG